nr:unnamed protein product [Callosobruchus chinensis]
MLSRLHPDYQKLGDYINLELVPFQRVSYTVSSTKQH